MITLTDQIGRTLKFKSTPIRIVSLVPSQTELLCDLGLEEKIVGVTKFCVHPKHIKRDKTVVGGTKAIHIDQIKTLNPDIILCNKEENTEDIVLECEQICNVHVSDIYNIPDCLNLIQQYGRIFNCTHLSEKICNDIDLAYDSFKIFIKDKTSKRVAYFIWKEPWMVAAQKTFIHHLLTINKFDNVFGHLERYPEIQIERLKQLNPNIVFLSSEPFPFNESHINHLKLEMPHTKIIIVDGEMFSWYGSRLKKAFNYFMSLRHNL